MSSLINRLQGGNTQPNHGVLNEEQLLIQGPPPGPPPPPAPVAPLPHQPGVGAPGVGPPPPQPPHALLPEPKTVAATGLPLGMIIDLALKTLYYTSNLTGHDIATTMRLPFYGVVDQALLALKKEELCEVTGTAGVGEAASQYAITQKGMERGAQVLRRSSGTVGDSLT